jgi:phosphonate ABC transporter permease subunit PhnE
MNPQKKSPLLRSLQTGLIAFLVLIIYAYGFEITKVNLEELRSETRQESLVRVTRALAQPDILKYDQETEVVNAPVYVTCPEGREEASRPDPSGPYLTISPSCAEPGETVTVEGFNFAPNTEGPLRFVPGSDPTNIVTLGNLVVKTDEQGHFVQQLKLPNRPSDDVQYIRATLNRNVGTPHFTKSAQDTWDKIVETVFLALLATTFGTILAIPLSFIAARNLMKPVRSPLAGISLSLLGWPIGIWLGVQLVGFINRISEPIMENALVNILSVIVLPIVILYCMRWAVPEAEAGLPTARLQIARLVTLFLVALAGVFVLYQFSALTMNAGLQMNASLGAFAFIGRFLFQLSDILRVFIPVAAALIAGGFLSSILGRVGQRATERSAEAMVKILNMLTASLAGATIFGLLGWLVEWLYQIGRPGYTFWTPVLVGASLGLLLALFTKAKDTLPSGLVIYYITRTILNALRSVEALVMAIVFVIAVGIGPFAGMMALGLHTIVSLAKLYSEQVESIMAGPLEAIQATGANRLQTIIYAVIPQIIPPYISYTMYRWDINVRMSTIIGFVGGGGIGFLLQQNINLLNYRAASTQMLAIAIVVASMDYISSVLREKYV